MKQKIVAMAVIAILITIICKGTEDRAEIKTAAEEMESMSRIEIVIPEPTPEPEAPEPQTETKFQDLHSMDWDADESYLLAKIAMAEAEGEGTEGKAMVIMVVLNRVWSNDFPGTIEEVIFEDGQFSPTQDGRFEAVEPDAECWEALRMIMVEKWDESDGALYFEATYNGENTWHSRNLEYIKTVGNHNFYK